jgi:hypothetical protein
VRTERATSSSLWTARFTVHMLSLGGNLGDTLARVR